MTRSAETASGFYYWFESNYFIKYETDRHSVFRIDSPEGVDDCCEIGLRSLKGVVMATFFY